MGKSGVSGRNSIWKSLFAFGFSRPQLFLLGKTSALTYYERYDSLNNSHNAYMQMLSNYGMIVTVIFIVSLVLLTIKLGKMVNDKYSYAAYIGAVAILINCSFETHIVDAIIGMTFMWILLYRLIIVRESS